MTGIFWHDCAGIGGPRGRLGVALGASGARPGHADNTKNHCFYTRRVRIYLVLKFAFTAAPRPLLARRPSRPARPPRALRFLKRAPLFYGCVINDSRARSLYFYMCMDDCVCVFDVAAFYFSGSAPLGLSRLSVGNLYANALGLLRRSKLLFRKMDGFVEMQMCNCYHWN